MSSMRLAAFAGFVLMAALLAQGGDPVPDVDVTVEQVPGAGVFLEIPNGAPFDRLVLSGPRSFLAGLEPDRLPTGWALSREGRTVVLSGPAVAQPTRLRLRAGGDRLERGSVDWEVSLAGRSLARRKNVVPRTVPPRAVRNSLQGVVVLPEQVSPGEAVALRPLPGADLPPGRFVLSGIVTETLSDAQLATAGRGLPNEAKPPQRGFTLRPPAGTSCLELAPLAAALLGGGQDGGCPECKSYYESRSNTARQEVSVRAPSPTESGAVLSGWEVESFRPLGDETPSAGSRPRKALYRTAPTTAGFSIDEKGVKVWELPSAAGEPFRLGVRTATPAGARPRSTWVPFAVSRSGDGCLFTPRESDLYDLARTSDSAGDPDTEPLQVAAVPADARVGTALALQYLDVFGDLVLDVPAAEGTAIVEPAPEQQPCVRAATAYAQAEDTVCVCGHFPSAAAQAGLWLDERSAGAPQSASTRSIQLAFPAHATSLGRHVWSGNPEAGFAATCRAETQRVEIRGELNQERLLSGQSTPMRLTVVGTVDRVPLRIRNLSPEIIEIEGGLDQTLESSGGSPNSLTRTVRGLGRGAFNVEFQLAVDRCPCEGG
jgi:hypothetical protein